MRFRRTMYRITAVTIAVLVAVVLAEVALRFTGFEFKLYPSKVQVGYPDPVTIRDLYQPDGDLLWIPKNYSDIIQSAVEAHPSLVLMGCSCTELGRYDEYLKELVDAQHPRNTLRFLNLGVSGWSSYQGLQQLKRDVVRIKPRVVTIYYGWNDHWCTFGIPDREIAGFNLQHPRALTLLSSKSRVAQLFNKTAFSRKFEGRVAQRRVNPVEFRWNLEQMVQVARENSIIPVLLTAPSGHQRGEEPAELAERWLVDLSDLIPLHEEYVELVRDVALDHDVHFIDLYRLFRGLSEEELDESFDGDGIHLTKQGNKRIAQYLYEYFVQSGLVNEFTVIEGQRISLQENTTAGQRVPDDD